MSMATLLFLVIGILFYGLGIYVAINNYVKEKDSSVKKIHIFVICIIILIGAFITIIALNIYSYI